MHIAIVDADFAGLTVKILKAQGREVTVDEKDDKVGGVWAALRRYPGLTTQNVRSTCALSDFLSPADYPEWPSGAQAQTCLAAYARRFQRGPHLRVRTEVLKAEPAADGGSRSLAVQLAVIDLATDQRGQHRFDCLIVCNGTFSQPKIPDFEGAAGFQAAGGVICHASP